MLKTLVWFFFFWAYMIGSVVLMIPLIVLRTVNLKSQAQRYMTFLSRSWARMVVQTTGTRVTVHGLEQLPSHNRICFVANHQGNFDIPILIGYLPKTIGFIAKQELRYFLILNVWMEAMHCVFIKRSSPRESVAVINRAARQISEGHPMVVFPEGTRSKGPAMAPFRPGSLKLALRSGATIVPVTIDGSYMIYEGNNNRITPAAVNLIIHKPVEVALLTEQERKAISQRLRDIIQSGQRI